MKLVLTFLLVFFSTVTNAQIDELKQLPGYIDFGELSSAYGRPKVKINIGRTLLKFVSAMAKESDKDGREAAELLQNLQGVRVEVYDLEDDAGPALKVVDDVSSALEKRKWEAVVSVEDEDEERVRIFVNIDGEKISGLVVMAVNGGTRGHGGNEAVFINIIGELDPAKVGKVTRALDIDVDL